MKKAINIVSYRLGVKIAQSSQNGLQGTNIYMSHDIVNQIITLMGKSLLRHLLVTFVISLG